MSSYPYADPPRHNDSAINVNSTERTLSAIGGGVLTLLGLRRRGVGGILTALAGAALIQRGMSGHCAMYQSLNINSAEPEPYWVERAAPRRRTSHNGQVHLETAVTIDQTSDFLYHWWRDFTNLPQVMRHLKTVTVNGSRSHWTMRNPITDGTLEWDAEQTEDRPGEVIGWTSVDDADIVHRGRVEFKPAPGKRGTVVRMKIDVAPPAGAAGAAAAKVLRGLTEQQFHEDLRRFKQLMETGEIATTDGQPHG